MEKLIVTLTWYEARSLDDAAEVLGLELEAAEDSYWRAVTMVVDNLRSAGWTPAPVEQPHRHLRVWTKVDVDALCAREWGRYDRALASHYTEYFAGHEDLRGEQKYSARDP